MDYILNSILVEASDIATVTSTSRLFVGLNCISNYLPVGTRIKTILTPATIELTNNALDDFTGNIIYTDLSLYQWANKCQALKDIQSIIRCEGQYIQFVLRDESQVTRDDYNSIKSKTQVVDLKLKAFPVMFNANKQYLEKVGLREDCEVIIHTATQDWIDAGYNYDDIDIIRSSVKINGETYKVKEKTQGAYLGNMGCTIILGLKL
jgi:hypothetical protein